VTGGVRRSKRLRNQERSATTKKDGRSNPSRHRMQTARVCLLPTSAAHRTCRARYCVRLIAPASLAGYCVRLIIPRHTGGGLCAVRSTRAQHTRQFGAREGVVFPGDPVARTGYILPPSCTSLSGR
jgi:hypothetical protein